MPFEVISDGDGPDYEIYTCPNCGRQVTLQGVGGDVAFCPCENENDGPEGDGPTDMIPFGGEIEECQDHSDREQEED